MTSDRILGGVALVVAIAMGWAAKGYVAVISYEPVGPRAFPLLLAVLIGICGLWLLAKPSPESDTLARNRLVPLLGCMVAIVVYALLFQWLGFPVATTLMAVPVGMAFGGNWRQSLAGGIALGIGLYFLFDKLLDIVLPTGVLSFALGR